jgi:hypothetical protein
MHFHFHSIKLADASNVRSDLVLLYSLSFGPVVHQASCQFTQISLGPIPIFCCRSLVFFSQTLATRP